MNGIPPARAALEDTAHLVREAAKRIKPSTIAPVRLFPRRPLDWSHGAGRSRAESPGGVDIIVPIYGAPEFLAKCLASVAAQTDLTRHRLLLVIDGPQDEAVETIVKSFASVATVLRNEQRLGFTRSVNRGMSASRNDVVLLNSDTVVTARWLEKLIAAAYSDGDVGTVTPLSNEATLCSVPRAFEENLIPSGFDAGSFAALVERVSVREYPRLPTGVGFCLYIRRALLDDIGLFDEERFGNGYGEENDFCMRALAHGWLHVADDATFVYHAGHRSFGSARAARQRAARRTLERVHPRYMATIADFMRRDPLADVRARICVGAGSQPARSRAERDLRKDGPAESRPLHIAHLVHGWPPFQHAGAELYAYWLATRQRDLHHVVVYARSADPARADGEAVEWLDGGLRVRLVTNHFRARNPWRRNALRDRRLERDFERFLEDERPDLLHVHHLGGLAFSLVRVARRLRIPIVMQIQDWWFLCARVNQYDADGKRCTGPAPAKCASCRKLTNIPPVPLTNRLMHIVRRRAARAALRAADAYIAGSNAIRADYAREVASAKPFQVIPYGVAISAADERRAPARLPIRFGYVGSIAPHKGVHVAVEAMRGIGPADATLHLWGDASALPDYTRTMSQVPGVRFEGAFREEEKERVFAAIDVLLVPSIGLESFGLAAREAMARGVPVIASSGGALDEMFAAGVCGEFVPAGDAAALRAILRRIIDDPAMIDRWSERLPRPKSVDEHAREIDDVYRSVLRR
jgi:GT2 family glycosyltransferase/glycosyltransferase involved in cell wall biosynthesis